MPEKPRERFVRFSLITGEESYAAQGSQNPETSRRLKSLLPSLAGDLKRERPHPKYLPTLLPAGVGWLWQFDKKASDGSFTSHFFAATSTKLYHQESGAWVEVTAVGTLVGYPQAVNLNNLMHFTDGAANWIFDGTNWVKEGLAIPVTAPWLSTRGYKPTRCKNVSGSSWIYPTAAALDDDVRAIYNDTTQTYLHAINLGIATADTEANAITGFTVKVRGRGLSATTAERQIDVAITTDGTAVAGVAKTAQQLGTVDTELILGGPTDLWGTSGLTGSNLASPSFGALVRKTTATANQIEINSIELIPHYLAGQLDIITNRYYWYTCEEENSTVPERNHESTSSPRSLGTGAQTDRKIRVRPFNGLIDTPSGSTAVAGSTSSQENDFNAAYVGLTLYAALK